MGAGNGGGAAAGGSPSTGRNTGFAGLAAANAARGRGTAVTAAAGLRAGLTTAGVLVALPADFPAGLLNGRAFAIEQPKLLPRGAACQQPRLSSGVTAPMLLRLGAVRRQQCSI
jgi:hypothetical protein